MQVMDRISDIIAQSQNDLVLQFMACASQLDSINGSDALGPYASEFDSTVILEEFALEDIEIDCIAHRKALNILQRCCELLLQERDEDKIRMMLSANIDKQDNTILTRIISVNSYNKIKFDQSSGLAHLRFMKFHTEQSIHRVNISFQSLYHAERDILYIMATILSVYSHLIDYRTVHYSIGSLAYVYTHYLFSYCLDNDKIHNSELSVIDIIISKALKDSKNFNFDDYSGRTALRGLSFITNMSAQYDKFIIDRFTKIYDILLEHSTDCNDFYATIQIFLHALLRNINTRHDYINNTCRWYFESILRISIKYGFDINAVYRSDKRVAHDDQSTTLIQFEIARQVNYVMHGAPVTRTVDILTKYGANIDTRIDDHDVITYLRNLNNRMYRMEMQNRTMTVESTLRANNKTFINNVIKPVCRSSALMQLKYLSTIIEVAKKNKAENMDVIGYIASFTDSAFDSIDTINHTSVMRDVSKLLKPRTEAELVDNTLHKSREARVGILNSLYDVNFTRVMETYTHNQTFTSTLQKHRDNEHARRKCSEGYSQCL